jgi:hypothetical protein
MIQVTAYPSFYTMSPSVIFNKPCHPSIEDDTEIFDTIYKWDVPSIQLKFVPRHSTSFREVDRLSLPFIDLYVPALTP